MMHPTALPSSTPTGSKPAFLLASGLVAALFACASPSQAQVMMQQPDPTAYMTVPISFIMTPADKMDPNDIRKINAGSAKEKHHRHPDADQQEQASIAPNGETPSSMQSGSPAMQTGDAGNDDSVKGRAVMVDINSATLNYDKDRDVYVATGAVHMVISEQNSELYADKLTYDQNQDLAIAEGHVVIIKNGQRTDGSYAKIDLTRKSALINDNVTTISAVRIKAKRSFVNDNALLLEDGRLIISGTVFQDFIAQGGLTGVGQSVGKNAGQAKLQRAYSKRVYDNRRKMNQNILGYDERLRMQRYNQAKANFDENPDKLNKLGIKADEIDIVRHEDGYDKITLHHPDLYYGRFKLATAPDTDFSYDEPNKQIQYLGPDIGADPAYGGLYAGPGWDVHMGRGSLRFSPILAYGTPGYYAPDGKSGSKMAAGPGVGAALHFRDPDTALDLLYNSRLNHPVFFGDRRLIGENIHLMASYGEIYQNGLLGQDERPSYIAQVTDYRILKDFGKLQLTSFESVGFAKDNFHPNFQESFFVTPKSDTPQTLGRAQFQLQLQNTAPLVSFGKHTYLGMRAQLLTAAYSSADFLALGRIGPNLNFNLFEGRVQSTLSYTVSKSIGQTPFVFDSYYGGAQNVGLSNLIRLNKYVSFGSSNSFSLNRDNAKNALIVGNLLYLVVGPPDIKASIGYDFINNRSYFGFNYYPGPNNTVIKYDKMKVTQPAPFSDPNAPTKF